jgi:hypothetical protein
LHRKIAFLPPIYVTYRITEGHVAAVLDVQLDPLLQRQAAATHRSFNAEALA